MITGAHSILYTQNADADRAFFRDVLGLPHVDVGGGWLIFGLPPAEVAMHPGDGKVEIYLMCDDIHAFISQMTSRGVACSEVHEEAWGSLTNVTLPGGGLLGVYQPKHARPAMAGVKAPRARSGAKTRKAPPRAKKASPKPKKASPKAKKASPKPKKASPKPKKASPKAKKRAGKK